MVPPFSGGQDPLSVYWTRGFWLSDKLVVTKGKKLSNIQLVAPDIHAEDATGMCLRFTQRVFQNKNPYYYNSAWIAWLNAVHKRYGPLPEDIAVPVYFEHWGTYGSPPTYDNWGHIAVRFPGGGVLSSPASGYGQQWFPDIGSVERTFNARYVGWAYDVGGLMVADVAPDAGPAVTPKPERDRRNPVEYITGDTNNRKKKQVFPAGRRTLLTKDDSDKTTALTSKVGDYSLDAEVHVSGKAGSVVTLSAYRYVWDSEKRKYVEYVYLAGVDVQIGKSGVGRAVLPITNRVSKASQRIGVELSNPKSGSAVTVERFSWKGLRWER